METETEVRRVGDGLAGCSRNKNRKEVKGSRNSEGTTRKENSRRY
jgi:hypothetical protein